MARRRLTVPDLAATAARPEPGPERAGDRFPGAPIARVAAEAVEAAALRELSDTLERARETGRMVLDLPLGEIAPDHLARDRMPVEDPEMASLRESIRAHGQRTPVEVTPLAATGTGALPYGLISGWRRLMALKALHAETGDPRFATIQALVRRPETAADAYVAMIEENEIRLGLSQYERARVAARAADRGVFPDEETALRTLFAAASRPKRSRIRSFLVLYRALDDSLRFPAHLPERLGLALVERLRAGEAHRIVAGLAAAAPETPEAELAVLARLSRPERAPPPAPTVRRLRPDVTLEQSLRGRTLTLKLKGAGVTPELARAVAAALENLPGKPSGTA